MSETETISQQSVEQYQAMMTEVAATVKAAVSSLPDALSAASDGLAKKLEINKAMQTALTNAAEAWKAKASENFEIMTAQNKFADANFWGQQYQRATILSNELSNAATQSLSDFNAGKMLSLAADGLSKGFVVADIAVNTYETWQAIEQTLIDGNYDALGENAFDLAVSGTVGAIAAAGLAAAGVGLGATLGILGVAGVGAYYLGKYLWEDLGVGKFYETYMAPEYERWGAAIYDLVNGNFIASQIFRPPVDPLAFDLDGDGIETLAENGNAGVLFDHEGNNVKTATGWIAPDDGFLVYDRNGNGVIDNGTELFGDNTALNAGGIAANGFEALADFDTNADGVVDANDANFAGLRIWQDINSDGISQASELLTLEQAGVASINTAYEDSSIAQNGNVISGLGSYTRTDGTSSSIGSATSLVNLDLATSSFYSAFTDSIPVTAEAALLPTMNGSGMVRNMQEAASLDAGFSSALTSYANATTRGEQKHCLMI